LKKCPGIPHNGQTQSLHQKLTDIVYDIPSCLGTLNYKPIGNINVELVEVSLNNFMLLHMRSALHVSEGDVNGALGDLTVVHVS
jgi:hypothetical protein